MGTKEDCRKRATVTHAQGKVNLHLDYNSKRKGANERHFKEMERQILYVWERELS